MAGMNGGGEGAVQRLFDANANRAREALRVLEDYARFVLDHEPLSAELKSLRHELAVATGPYLRAAILHRDTPRDVGTAITTAAEQHRSDLADVVTAAGKRLGEAVRSLEEYAKTFDAAVAVSLEAIRYRFYTVEQQLARTLRPPTAFAAVRLYVLITESACRHPWEHTAEQAILGGADALQLREKTLDGGELLARARRFVALCRRHGVLSIINDRPDIALLSGADGVHVGQDDLPAADVRQLIGPEKIVGVSTHQLEHAERAVTDGADYVGVGPVFRSSTKPRDISPGLPYAAVVAATVSIPAVAIAGITAGNVDQVVATGVAAIAVTAAVTGSDDPRIAAAELKGRLSGMGQALQPAPGGGTPSPSLADDRAGRPSEYTDPRQARMPAPPDQLHIHRRRLPPWQLRGATYFITYRVLQGELSPPERLIVLDHLRAGDGQFYDLLAAVVMPDHAHEIIEPKDGFDLPRILMGTKGVSARLVNAARGGTGALWQDESFDRIIRDAAELTEQLEYMVGNPVKAGLVEDPWAYPALYVRPGAGW